MENEDHKNITRISLTVPALERLLGGDSELEVRLRHQVVEQFAKHRLTPLLSTPKFEFLEKQIKEFTEKTIKERIGRFDTMYSGYMPAFTADFKMRFDVKVEAAIKKILESVNFSEMVQKFFDERVAYWQGYVEQKTKELLDHEIENKIQRGIAERLAFAAKL